MGIGASARRAADAEAELAAVKAEHGANSLEYAAALNNVAENERQSGDSGSLDQAEGHFVEALTILKKLVKEGEPHKTIAVVSHNLATTYRLNEKPSEALKMFKETLAIDRKLAEQSREPEDHQDVARDLNNVATVLWNIDHDNQAAVMYGKEAIAIASQILGQNDPLTLQYRENWEKGGIDI